MVHLKQLSVPLFCSPDLEMPSRPQGQLPAWKQPHWVAGKATKLLQHGFPAQLQAFKSPLDHWLRVRGCLVCNFLSKYFLVLWAHIWLGCDCRTCWVGGGGEPKSSMSLWEIVWPEMRMAQEMIHCVYISWSVPFSSHTLVILELLKSGNPPA